MRIGVIIGSTRRGRKGAQVASWVATAAEKADAATTSGATFELIDISEHNLGFFEDDQHPAMANKQYSNPATQAWSDVIDAYDAFIFVTPEYNHSVPASMKNAFDMLFAEWAHKPVGFVGYGAAGGIRAVEHWRAIVANVYMLDARQQLSFFLETDFVDNTLMPNPVLETNLAALVEELVTLTQASKTLRATT